jgi:hypothetical protein
MIAATRHAVRYAKTILAVRCKNLTLS